MTQCIAGHELMLFTAMAVLLMQVHKVCLHVQSIGRT